MALVAGYVRVFCGEARFSTVDLKPAS